MSTLASVSTPSPAAKVAAKPDIGAIVKFVAVLIIALVVISPLFLLFVASLKPDRFQILADMGSFRAFWV
ncbi:MAG: carbohydrate ABC transporter permease, partial [Rhizobiales bacterium]|nr:carbohydrate ABC transporter permease [Hyphomicrobiales bacterium]